MNKSFAVGFIKRAQEYALSEGQALDLLKQAAGLLGYSPEIAGGLMGGLPASVAGAGVGALIPSEDEKGKTHRLRNALIGGLGAGALGAGVGGTMGHEAYLDMLRKFRVLADTTQPMSGSGIISKLLGDPRINQNAAEQELNALRLADPIQASLAERLLGDLPKH